MLDSSYAELNYFFNWLQLLSKCLTLKLNIANKKHKELIRCDMTTDKFQWINGRSSHRRCSVRKSVFRNFAKFRKKQENTCARVSFLIKLQATFFIEHLRAIASVMESVLLSLVCMVVISCNIYNTRKTTSTFVCPWGPSYKRLIILGKPPALL